MEGYTNKKRAKKPKEGYYTSEKEKLKQLSWDAITSFTRRKLKDKWVVEFNLPVNMLITGPPGKQTNIFVRRKVLI